MRTVLVCEPGFLIGNNKLGVKVCWRVLLQDKGEADVAWVLLLTQASSDTKPGTMHCPLNPPRPPSPDTHTAKRDTTPPPLTPPHPPAPLPTAHPRFREITRWLFLFPHRLNGPSETSFHFTNICWRREIPNLSRAFSQIPSLRLNADFSLLPTLPCIISLLPLYLQGISEN